MNDFEDSSAEILPGPPSLAAISRRFAAAWGAARPPRLEEFLAGLTEPERSALLCELLRVELDYRVRYGDHPLLWDYLARFPDDDELIRGEFRRRLTAGETSFRRRTPDEEPAVPADDPAAPVHETAPDLQPQTPALPPGWNPPGYEILGELGRGGMGVVYKAWQMRADRVVALKVVRAGSEADAAQLARFWSEAEAAARLQHPNIVQIFEVGEHQGLPFFSLEFCPGGSLARKLGGNPLAAGDTAWLVEQLARAVQAAHDRNVLHRDLKPLNILLAPASGRGDFSNSRPEAGANWVPKVSDFGLAKRLDGDIAQTQSGVVVGTPPYMAPEQAAGNTAAVGPAVDIYALGAILYECLTGRPPFQASSREETLRQVVHDDPLPPRRLAPATPRDLETICLKCLHKEPRHRYGSAAALADDLRRFQRGEPITARPLGAGEALWCWARRHPTAASLAIAATVAVVVLLSVALGYEVSLKAARRAQEEADRLAVLARQAESAAQETARTQRYFALLNQARERASRPRPGWTWASLQDLAEAADLPVAVRDLGELRSEAAASLAGFDVRKSRVLVADGLRYLLAQSPDGKLLAAAQSKAQAYLFPGGVLLIDPESGQVRRRLTFPVQVVWKDKGHAVQDGARSVAFRPDGGALAVGTRSGWIHFWNLVQGEAGPLSWKATDGKPVETLVFSRGGKSILSASKDENVLKCWDAATPGQELARFEVARGGILGVVINPAGDLAACACSDGIELLSPGTLRRKAEPLPFGVNRLFGFHPDGATLAAEWLNKVFLIDVAGRRVVRELPQSDGDSGHDGAPEAAQFRDDGAVLLSTCGSDRDRKAAFWEVASGRLLLTLNVGQTGALSALLRPNGGGLVVASGGEVALYETARAREQAVLAQHQDPLHTLALSGDGRFLACTGTVRKGAAAGQRFLTVWDSASGEGISRCQAAGHGDIPITMAVHPGGLGGVWSDGDDKVDPWTACAPLGDPVHAEDVRTLNFDPAGRRIWGVVKEEIVQSWDWPNGRPATRWSNAVGQVLSGRSGVTCLAVGREGALAGCADGGVRLLAAADGQPRRHWSVGAVPVRAVALSADERLAAVGTQDGEMTLLRLPDCEVVAAWKEHQDGIETVAFSADGRLLASGSRDRTVRLYARHGETFHYLLTLRTPTGSVTALRFHPDGRTLFLLASRETAVRVWHLDRLRERLAALHLADDWPE